MNCLLVDAGNTAVKWATAGPAGIVSEVQRLANADADFGACLAGAFAAAAPFDAAFGCCVASDALRAAIDAALVLSGGGTVRWLGSQAHSDAGGPRLVNGYRDAAQLGADRWHAMLGARALHADRPLVVVHAGTATTIDCVSAAGQFVGGVILPGTALMLDALAQRTARLPRSQGSAVDFPDNTDDAIATGVADAQAGAVERSVARFSGAQGQAVTVLLGGGNAAALRAQLRLPAGSGGVELAHNLVLRGLAERARSLVR